MSINEVKSLEDLAVFITSGIAHNYGKIPKSTIQISVCVPVDLAEVAQGDIVFTAYGRFEFDDPADAKNFIKSTPRCFGFDQLEINSISSSTPSSASAYMASKISAVPYLHQSIPQEVVAKRLSSNDTMVSIRGSFSLHSID